MTDPFVLDCSMTMAWFFEDKKTEKNQHLLEKVERDGALTPIIWPLEVANSLLTAERKGRTTAEKSRAFMDSLDCLQISTERETHYKAFDLVYSLAKQYDLTSYDASYLELAKREDIPLATNDKKLSAAAKKAGIELA